MDTVKNHRQPHIVTIGGGTGSFVLLSGLKEFPIHISAIVSMADDGGSTGVLRDNLGVLPPGDVRQCLAALARATPEVRELFSYRFVQGDMKGHNAGNLFLSALEKITGSFPKAVAVAGKILNVYGRVLPVSEGNMRLLVELNNGIVLEGESYLDDDERVREHGVRDISLAYPVTASAEALEAIAKADLVVIGPGDVHGSIIPNLLVGGISQSLHDTPARIAVVANVTNKKGLTGGFNAHTYAATVEKHLRGRRIDVLVCNTAEPSKELAQRYEEQEGKGMFVLCDTHKNTTRIIGEDFLNEQTSESVESDTLAHTRSFIRHDSRKLADVIMRYIKEYV
tara:strand:+ start:1167 stop:2183 length:1017 start_codon:yes stop_codon:yes gene_type:complete